MFKTTSVGVLGKSTCFEFYSTNLNLTMASKFSAALQIVDLDDFISPGQECIKPQLVEKRNIETGARIKIQDEGFDYDEIKKGPQKLEVVQISLNDCLACSGCITSAESVLISQQNFTEIMKILNTNLEEKENNGGKLIVVSMSIQAILSFSWKYEMSPEHTAKCLATFFKKLGADLIVEMSAAEGIALLEAQNEFMERYQNKGNSNSLPMLASSCPGWICYAEKTHGNFILPFISTTKSPQQIMGKLVKYNLGYQPDKVYHITLMPCFDKKLEASRNEFFNIELNAKDVDCVITTIELEQLLKEQQILINELNPTELDYPWGRHSDITVLGYDGSGSGGYAHHILINAARGILGVELTELNWKPGRNIDIKEITIENKEKNISLRFAIATGFRNIQNIVQKMKRGRSNYDYVEIMACPGGCLNGGAQIKASDRTREVINQLENLYKNTPSIAPEQNTVIKKLYKEWLDGPGSDKSLALLHTSYRPVEKSTTVLNLKW